MVRGEGEETEGCKKNVFVCVCPHFKFLFYFYLKGRAVGVLAGFWGFFLRLCLGRVLSQHMVVSAPVMICVKEDNEPFF